MFNEGGKAVTRFFGKEGTAYTWWTESGEKSIGTIAESLRKIWGADFYGEIPKTQRDLIESKKVYVTVNLETGLTPEDFPVVKEDQIHEDDDTKAAKILGEGMKESTKVPFSQGILWMAAGAAIVMGLVLLGVFPK